MKWEKSVNETESYRVCACVCVEGSDSKSKRREWRGSRGPQPPTSQLEQGRFTFCHTPVRNPVQKFPTTTCSCQSTTPWLLTPGPVFGKLLNGIDRCASFHAFADELKVVFGPSNSNHGAALGLLDLRQCWRSVSDYIHIYMYAYSQGRLFSLTCLTPKQPDNRMYMFFVCFFTVCPSLVPFLLSLPLHALFCPFLLVDYKQKGQNSTSRRKYYKLYICIFSHLYLKSCHGLSNPCN